MPAARAGGSGGSNGAPARSRVATGGVQCEKEDVDDASTRPDFRLDVQGLRAIAIVLVVGYHAGFERVFQAFGFSVFGGGYVGVDAFFVVSGFLITRVLLRELRTTGSLSLSKFYRRRARRLLPLSIITLVFTLLTAFIALPAFEWHILAKDAAGSALFLANANYAIQTTDYLAGDAVRSPFLHFWSLSLEEQFYLVWPAIILVGRRRPWGILSLAVGIAAASLIVSIWMTSSGSPWAFFGLNSRAWELSAGALLAVLEQRLRWAPQFASVLRAVGLALLLGAVTFFTESTPFPGPAALVPVVGTALFIAAGPSALLSRRPFQFVGGLSYSWYLTHWPCLVLAGPLLDFPNNSPLWVRVGAVAVSFGAAWLLHSFVEARALQSSLLLRPRPAMALAVGGMVAVGVVAGPALVVAGKRSHADDVKTPDGARFDRVANVKSCSQDFYDTEATACVLGDPSVSTTVALVGDSHAEHLVPAFEKLAGERHWRLLVFTKSACLPFAAPRYLPRLRRAYAECDAWRDNVVARIYVEHVSFVFLTSALSTANSVLDSAGNLATPEMLPSIWSRGIYETIKSLPISTIAYYIEDIPTPSTDVPVCLADHVDGRACAILRPNPRAAPFAAALVAGMAEAGREGAFVVSLSSAVCPKFPCSVRDDDGVIRFRDGNHMTATYAARLAPALTAALGLPDP